MPELGSPMQHRLDGLEQVLVLVVELEIRVAGDPERRVIEDLHPREQAVQMRGDDLLERDEAEPFRQWDEPG